MRRLIAGVLFVGCVACARSGAAPFVDHPYADVRTAIEHAGLHVCDEDTTLADFSGSYEGRTWEVSLGACRSSSSFDSDGLVVADAYNARVTRDRAAKDARGSLLVSYTYGRFVLSVDESSKPAVVDRFQQAMRSLGAKPGYDRRKQ